MTIGVLNRVNELADRSIEETKKLKNRIPYKNLVPLPEIIAGVLQKGVNTKTVQIEYNNLISKFGNEFKILLDIGLKEIEKNSSKQIAVGIERVRNGEIYVAPGYDGIFGIVKVFKDEENKSKSKQGNLL